MENYIELTTVKTYRYNPISKQYYWVISPKPNTKVNQINDLKSKITKKTNPILHL